MIALALLLLAGCGGRGGASSAPPSRGGGAVLTVKWPARTARFIPLATNSLVVKVLQGTTVVDTEVVPRPAAGATTTTTHIGALPFDTLNVEIGAFPNADGTGVAQAKGAGTMTVTSTTLGRVTVSLDSTVASLALPTAPAVAVSDTAPIAVSAKDADGNVVLLSAGTGVETVAWSVADPGVATIAGTGPTATLTGVALGTTTVTARLRVKDDGTTLETTAPLTASVATLALSAAGEVTYGSTTAGWSFGRFGTGTSGLPRVTLQGLLSPTRSTATTVALAQSGPLAGFFGVPAPTSLTIVANTATGSALYGPTHVDADTLATVTATVGALTATATVTVKPNPLDSVTGTVVLTGGTAGTGTVNLGLYAMAAEGVSLACDDPTVSLPASVTVPAPTFYQGGGGGPGGGGQGGQGSTSYYSAVKTVNFTFTAPAVTVVRTVTITATRAGVSKSFAVTINP